MDLLGILEFFCVICGKVAILCIPVLFFYVLYRILKKVSRFMDDVHDIAKSRKEQ